MTCSTHRALYAVSTYNVRRTLYNVWRTLYNIWRTWYIVQRILYIVCVHCIVYNARQNMNSVYHIVYSIHCTIYTAHYIIYTVHCMAYIVHVVYCNGQLVWYHIFCFVIHRSYSVHYSIKNDIRKKDVFI